MISIEEANKIITSQSDEKEEEPNKIISIDEANELFVKEAEVKDILKTENKDEDFVPLEKTKITISPMEMLSKTVDKDLVKTIEENSKKEKNITFKDVSKNEDVDFTNVLQGSVIDGNKLRTPIKDIIKYDGYYSWENFQENLLRRVFKGAAVDTANASMNAVDFVGNKFFEERPFEDVKKFDTIPEPTYFGGSFSRDIAGFSIPFLGFSKVAKVANVVTKIKPAKTLVGKITQSVAFGAAVGTVAEQFAFSPYETRISNLVESFPTLANPITEYLAANDADSEEQARLKMLFEGGLIGIPFDAFFTFLARGKKYNLKTNKIKNTDTATENLNIKREAKAEKIKKATTIKPKSYEGKVNLDTPNPKDNPDFFEPIISQKNSKKIESFFEELLVQGKIRRNTNLRISEQIYEVMTTPRIIQNVNFEKLLKKFKLNESQVMDYFVAGARTSAQNLNRLSQLSKLYGKFLKDGNVNPKLIDELNAQGVDADYLLHNTLRRLDGVRRAMMVGRWSTALRNYISQYARVGLNVLYEGFQYGADSVYTSLGGKIQKRTANPITAMEGFLNISRQFNPKKFIQVKKNVDNLLSAYPKQSDRLFLRYSSDVANTSVLKNYSPLSVAEKGSNLVNFLNKFQEFIVRRSVILSSLDGIIRNDSAYYKGKKLSELINDKNLINTIRKEDIAAAVDLALELTYAAEPKSGSLGEAFIRFVNKVPFTLSLAIPFPRFLVNSLKFLYQYSPAPTIVNGVRVFWDIPMAALSFTADGSFSKSFFQKIKAGDTSGTVKSMMGWALLGTAMQIRDSRFAGEKWNEIKIGDKTIDVYPYNPLAAYLYVADFVDRYQNGTLGTISGRTKEFLKVFAGTRGGTGLYLVDQLLESFASEGSNKGKKFINELVGKIAAQYMTPFKTYMGFLDAKDGHINASKDTKTATLENAKIDPTVSIVNNYKAIFNPAELPDLTSVTHAIKNEDGEWVARPLKPESINIFGKEIPGNVFTEFTGVGIVQTKNSAEKEFDKLNIQYREIFRSTGIPVLDRAFKDAFAPMVHNGLSKIVEQPGYQLLSINMKRLFINEFIKGAKKDTMEILQNDASLVSYIMEYNVSKIPRSQRNVLNDVLGANYLNQLILSFQKNN